MNIQWWTPEMLNLPKKSGNPTLNLAEAHIEIPDMNLRTLWYKNMQLWGERACRLYHHSPALTRLLWFEWKDMRGWDRNVFTFILFIITFFNSTTFSLQTQHCAHVLYALWAMKEKIWALRKGLVCGRHVCFVFTHTQTCQTNNTLHPPPTCSIQSCFSIAKPNLLPLAWTVSNTTVCNKVFSYCSWRKETIKTYLVYSHA